MPTPEQIAFLRRVRSIGRAFSDDYVRLHIQTRQSGDRGPWLAQMETDKGPHMGYGLTEREAFDDLLANLLESFPAPAATVERPYTLSTASMGLLRRVFSGDPANPNPSDSWIIERIHLGPYGANGSNWRAWLVVDGCSLEGLAGFGSDQQSAVDGLIVALASAYPEATQPAPKPNQSPAVWSLVMADMAQRDIFGAKQYGTRLQPGNGRDFLKDAYEEALDLAAYLRGAIYERDGK